MKEALPNPQTAHGDTHRSSRRPDSDSTAVNGGSPEPAKPRNGNAASSSLANGPGGAGLGLTSTKSAPATNPDSSSGPVNTSQAAQPGTVVGPEAEKQDDDNKKKPAMQRFWHNVKTALFYSKLNVLLVFVPAGIAVGQIHGLSPGIIFGMNAVAIVPLAGLLSFATESVAHRLGDSLGALLNVTFGNAVELIIL